MPRPDSAESTGAIGGFRLPTAGPRTRRVTPWRFLRNGSRSSTRLPPSLLGRTGASGTVWPNTIAWAAALVRGAYQAWHGRVSSRLLKRFWLRPVISPLPREYSTHRGRTSSKQCLTSCKQCLQVGSVD
jgi:hypothetical protein